MLATVGASVAPDVVHALPLVVWALLDGHSAFGRLQEYAVALPGHEPWLPQWVAFVSHRLHCVAHSAVVATAVTLGWWIATRTVPIALWGWWSHIVIDLFTHSAQFYPAAVLYPVSDWTFDGVAWNRPDVLLANHVMLALVWLWLACTRSRVLPTAATHDPR